MSKINAKTSEATIFYIDINVKKGNFRAKDEEKKLIIYMKRIRQKIWDVRFKLENGESLDLNRIE